jgi:hypothetical protein
LVDPDGRTDLGAIFRPLEITIKIIKFFAENKEALQRIGIGSAKILMGLAITALGTGGGAGITIGSGGTAALGGVALADAAIVAGGVCVGAGVADIIDGIVMMSQGNDGGGQTNRDTTNSISQSAKDAKPLNNSQAEQFAKDRGYKNVHQFKDTVLKDEGLGIKNSKRYDITVNNNTNESFLRAKPGNPDIPQAIPLQ